MKLIDVHCQYQQLFDATDDYVYAPEKIKKMFLNALAKSPTLSYIDEDEVYQPGDVVLVPYGSATRVGLVEGDCPLQELDPRIKYKKVIEKTQEE